MVVVPRMGERVLFLGDDWSEEHHDVELMDAAGRVLARARLPEGAAGMARLHAMIGGQLGDADDAEVAVGIETDRGLWVQALVAVSRWLRLYRATRARPSLLFHGAALGRRRSSAGERGSRGANLRFEAARDLVRD
jgi:Transposase